MAKLSGRLTAKLAEKSETYDQSLVDEINQRIKPPRPILEKDVYIRAMYIVSDNINSQGGRFGENELDALTELIIDAPVMIGHRRDSLPVARNFKAEKVTVDGRQWVKTYFYWIKDSEGAVDFKNNIDGGIYKECSISFLFSLPECSICGKDIRQCHHVPFEEYDLPEGGRAITHFWYRKIEKILETSLVFRGAIPDTRITDKLLEKDKEKVLLFSKTEIEDVSDYKIGLSRSRLVCLNPNTSTIPNGQKFWICPYQPGLLIRIKKQNKKIDYESPVLLSENIRDHLNAVVKRVPGKSFIIDTLLYATRGKDRLSGYGLAQLLESERQLHRLKIRFCDLLEHEGESFTKKDYASRLERLSGIFNKYPEIEIFNPVLITQDELSKNLMKDKSTRFNFGLEILTEDDAKGLSRFLTNGSNLIAGEVKSVDKRSKSQVTCGVSLIHDRDTTLQIKIPVHDGINPGTVLLLSERNGNSKNKSDKYQVVDILVGMGADRIDVSHYDKNQETVMYACQNDKQMMVEFISGNNIYRALIYYYSQRLLNQKRKFIADLKITRAANKENIRGEEIRLSSVTAAGKLIRLKLADKTRLFGDCQTLWLRPVLIDGEERYLFYGGSVNYQREEL
ncbi:MAG: hypothetical protein V3V99_09405 [candidate division Zixibacteria bacterium]